jgi:hypothetical protein
MRCATGPRAAALLASLVLFACTGDDAARPATPSPESVKARIQSLIPSTIKDRQAWAGDVYDVLTALRLSTTPAHVCAVLAVIEQESTYQADPPVPNLATISREEIYRRAGRAGVPEFAVRVALQLKSSNSGKTYDERLAAVRTEQDLSLMYEDFIGEVPLGKQLFDGWNPVHTAGPMQVSIAYAEGHAKAKPYPWPMKVSVRHEVFTRRGGLYFGTAHLLDYAAGYGDGMIYRFADFNAGQYASRNAAFQNAVALASGRKLDLDGDLIARSIKADAPAGQTEAAVRSLSSSLGMTDAQIRSELMRDGTAEFSRSNLHAKVFALADGKAGRAVPRAMVPKIVLQSPKITRKLTTEWFAQRVQTRYRDCLTRAA